VYTPENGALGCLMSHIKAQQKAIFDFPGQNILICEDDLHFPLSREETLTKMRNFVEDPLFDRRDVWMIESNPQKMEDTHDSDVKRLTEAQTTSGYVANTKYLKKILRVYSQALQEFQESGKWSETYNTDRARKPLQKVDKWYGIKPNIGAQRENPRIPKLVHLIWIGPKDPPKEMTSWTNDFANKHKDWNVRVWRDKDIDDMKLVNRSAYEDMKEWCGKADIARYEILYRHGGLYIDADTVWLGKDPYPFKGDFNVFQEENKLYANTIIATVPHHPILATMINLIQNSFDPSQPAWISVGPTLLTRVNDMMTADQKVTVVPIKQILCPTNWHGIDKKDALNTCKSSNAFAFHWGESTN
jgi:mannosyltransferase OCH1-like enzyme